MERCKWQKIHSKRRQIKEYYKKEWHANEIIILLFYITTWMPFLDTNINTMNDACISFHNHSRRRGCFPSRQFCTTSNALSRIIQCTSSWEALASTSNHVESASNLNCVTTSRWRSICSYRSSPYPFWWWWWWWWCFPIFNSN